LAPPNGSEERNGTPHYDGGILGRRWGSAYPDAPLTEDQLSAKKSFFFDEYGGGSPLVWTLLLNNALYCIANTAVYNRVLKHEIGREASKAAKQPPQSGANRERGRDWALLLLPSPGGGRVTLARRF
jgi:hypothetical protein